MADVTRPPSMRQAKCMCVCVEPEGCVWKADVVRMREENKTPLIPENDTGKGPSSRKGL